MVIPKTNFGLPGQMPGLQRRRTQRAKRTTSFPLNSNQPTTAQTAQGALGGSMAPPAREGREKFEETKLGFDNLGLCYLNLFHNHFSWVHWLIKKQKWVLVQVFV